MLFVAVQTRAGGESAPVSPRFDENTGLLSIRLFFSADREEHFQYQTPSALRSAPHGDSESWTNPPIGRRCVSPPRLGGLLLSDWIRPSLDTRSSWLFPAAAQGEISSPPLTFNFLHFRAAFHPPPASARCGYCCHGAAPEWLGFSFFFSLRRCHACCQRRSKGHKKLAWFHLLKFSLIDMHIESRSTWNNRVATLCHIVFIR